MANPKSYTAPHDVYVGNEYVKAGKVFVTDAEPGDRWESVTPKEAAAIEASQPQAGDPPIEGLSKAALEAIAVEKRVNPTGLSKQGLIDAIKAADEPAL